MKLSPRLEPDRIRDGAYRSDPGEPYGAFIVWGPCGRSLTILADDGKNTGWEHVSVSARRTPNWQEMSFVKDLFWSPDDWVMEFHPPQWAYVNNHPRCLHMWRPTDGKYPTPQAELVGIKALGNLMEAKR